MLELSSSLIVQFEESVIVSSSFLRVRELANGRPGKIFKQSTHTLKYVLLYSVILEIFMYKTFKFSSELIFVGGTTWQYTWQYKFKFFG